MCVTQHLGGGGRRADQGQVRETGQLVGRVLADTPSYWCSVPGGHMVQGESRSWKLSLALHMCAVLHAPITLYTHSEAMSERSSESSLAI